MSGSDTTSWRVIQGAAAGDPALRDEYARLHAPVMEAYLAARWRGSPLADEVQETFVEFFRPGGALEHAEPQRGGGFRTYDPAPRTTTSREVTRGRSDARSRVSSRGR